MSFSEFAITIRTLCVVFQCSEASGIRTEARNELVGGVVGSRHQIKHGGKARDLVPDDPDEKPRLIAAAVALGFYAQDEGDHVHVHDNLFRR